jgi:PAS domain S-box-containing protein
VRERLRIVPGREDGRRVLHAMATDRRTRQELIDEVTRLQAQLDEPAGEPPALEVAERLRESEARYRAIYELSPVGIGLSTSAGRVVSCNQAMAALTGYTIEELKALRLADTFVDSEERKDLRAELERHGRITDFPVRLKRKNGSVYWALLSITLIDLDGRPHLHTICQDITERVRAEEALHHEHALLERITSTSPIGITVVDRTGLITFANTRAEEILGFTRDGITDRTYNDPEWHITAIDGSPFPDENLPFEIVRRTGREVFDFRHAIEWPDGRRVLLSINAAPLTDAEGRFDGIVATILDITERIEATERLRASEEMCLLISENIPVAVYSALPDEHSTTLLITGQVEELSGYTRKEYLDDPALWPSIVLPEDRDRVWHAIEEHRARRSILDVEYRIIWFGSTDTWRISANADVPRRPCRGVKPSCDVSSRPPPTGSSWGMRAGRSWSGMRGWSGSPGWRKRKR